MKKRKNFKGHVFLNPLKKPLNLDNTKVCSIKEVCGGVPLPNDREHFYQGNSGCRACLAAKSKRRWEDKKASRENFI